MEVPENRRWMYNRLDLSRRCLTPEFEKGVKEFLANACQLPPFLYSKEIRCPCARCKLLKHLSFDEVKGHLYKHGFKPDYYVWISHGEMRTKYPSPVLPFPGVQRVSHGPLGNQLTQNETKVILMRGHSMTCCVLRGFNFKHDKCIRAKLAKSSSQDSVGASNEVNNEVTSMAAGGKSKKRRICKPGSKAPKIDVTSSLFEEELRRRIVAEIAPLREENQRILSILNRHTQALDQLLTCSSLNPISEDSAVKRSCPDVPHPPST